MSILSLKLASFASIELDNDAPAYLFGSTILTWRTRKSSTFDLSANCLSSAAIGSSRLINHSKCIVMSFDSMFCTSSYVSQTDLNWEGCSMIAAGAGGLTCRDETARVDN